LELVGIGVKASSCPQARRSGRTQRTPGRSQLPWLIVCIKDKNGQRSAVGITLQQLFDLFYGDEIHSVSGPQPTDLARGCPIVMGKADLGNPIVCLACHDRLSSRVTGRMMVKGAFGTGFRVTAGPHAGIDGIHRLPAFQRMLSEQRFGRIAVDLPIDERVEDTAPVTLKTGIQAQMRGREHGASRK